MYSDILRDGIYKKGLTQGKVSEECKKLNAPISRGQLNKIVSGKANPPEEKVTRALAKICDLDERKLVFEGYLEKAPKELKDFFNKLQDFLLDFSLDFLENDLKEELLKNNCAESKELLKEEYKKSTLTNLIIDILDMDDSIKNYDNIFGTEIVNKDIQLIQKEKPYITMEDDSMENMIPKGSKMRLKILNKYKNGDIVLVQKGNERIIRILFNIGKDICLHAMNRNYPSLYLKPEDYKIIAKITSIEIKL